ncbi:aquaporin [Streptomyces sp. NPDC026673]|uniref:MIP/aquaporin family protein n=1 Tax=Streptomyces sp. NPDC026673 TaxID=3155724 RepID=UPI0034101CAF
MGARAPEPRTPEDGGLPPPRRGARSRDARRSAWLAEFAATALLLFAMATLLRWLADPVAPLARAVPSAGGRLVVDAVVSGAAVGLLVLSPLGRRSGAHMNPAVSVAFWLLGALPGRDLAAYAVAQLAGSVAGVAAGRLLWGEALAGPGPDFAAVRAAEGVPYAAVFMAEAAATALLLAAVTHVAARPGPAFRVPLVAGAAVAVLILLTGGWAGGSFNPARQFGPALFSGDTRWLWVYVLAPLAAAVGFAAVRSRMVGVPPLPRMAFGEAPR